MHSGWVSLPIHAVFEGVSGFSCICLSVLLLVLVRAGKRPEAYVFPCAGLLVMGELDLFHAGMEQGNLFVWSRVAATLAGSLGFVCLFFPKAVRRPGVARHLPVIAFAVAPLVAAILLYFRLSLPLIVSAAGDFTYPVRWMHLISGSFFVAAAFWFSPSRLKELPDSDRFYMISFCLLQAIADFTFTISNIWGPIWWSWHFFRVAAALLLLIYAFRLHLSLDHSLNEALKALANDVVERKKGKDSLERSVSLLHATLESTADGILVVDGAGKIVSFNRRFISLWSLPEEILNSELDERALVYVLDQLKSPSAFLSKVNELYTSPELESHDMLEFKDGKIFERYSRPQRVGNQVVGRVWSFRDVTKRNRALIQVQQYASRQKALTDASRMLGEARLDIDAVLDVTGRWVTDHFHDVCVIRLFSEDKTRLETVAMHHSNPEVLETMKRLLPGASTMIDEEGTRQVVSTGHEVLVVLTPEEVRQRVRPEYWPVLECFPFHSWVIAPLRVAGGVIGVVSVFRHSSGPSYTSEDRAFFQGLADRAALAIDNAKLYAASQKAIRLREEFMSIASHELRTPLTPLRMQLQLLANFVRSGDIVARTSRAQGLQRLITDSDYQISRISRLIEDMMDATRLRTGRLKTHAVEVDLKELVSDAIEHLRPQQLSSKCDIEFQCDASVRGCWDKGRIEQVVSNLLSNAMKFGAGKPIQVTATTRGENAILSVRDSGIGIKPEDQRKIFERFERAVSVYQFGGLGLGLYISRQIVELHKGTIRVESQPGEGAVFIVELPLAQSQSAMGELPQAAAGSG